MDSTKNDIFTNSENCNIENNIDELNNTNIQQLNSSIASNSISIQQPIANTVHNNNNNNFNNTYNSYNSYNYNSILNSNNSNNIPKRSLSSISLTPPSSSRSHYNNNNTTSSNNTNNTNNNNLIASTSLSDFSSITSSPSIYEMSMGILSCGGNGGINIDYSGRDFNKIPSRLPCEKERIESFNCSTNNISIIPNDFFNYHFVNITSLNFENNKLKSIPKSIKNLISLSNLKLGNNKFKKFPKALVKLTNLVYLDLSNNKVEKITKDISIMKQLKELILSNNNIHNLPTQLTELTLFTLSIDNNPIQFPPLEICDQGLESIIDYLEHDKQQITPTQCTVQQTTTTPAATPVSTTIKNSTQQPIPLKVIIPTPPMISPVTTSPQIQPLTSSQSMVQINSSCNNLSTPTGMMIAPPLPTSTSNTSLSSSVGSNCSGSSPLSLSRKQIHQQLQQQIQQHAESSSKLFSANGDSMLIQSCPTSITNTNYPMKKIKSRPPSPKNSKEKVFEIQQNLLITPECKTYQMNRKNSIESKNSTICNSKSTNSNNDSTCESSDILSTGELDNSRSGSSKLSTPSSSSSSLDQVDQQSHSPPQSQNTIAPISPTLSPTSSTSSSSSTQPINLVYPIPQKHHSLASPIFEKFLSKFSSMKKSKSKTTTLNNSLDNNNNSTTTTTSTTAPPVASIKDRKLKKHSSLSEIDIKKNKKSSSSTTNNNGNSTTNAKNLSKLEQSSTTTTKPINKHHQKLYNFALPSSVSSYDINEKAMSSSCQLFQTNNLLMSSPNLSALTSSGSTSTTTTCESINDNEPSIKELMSSFNNASNNVLNQATTNDELNFSPSPALSSSPFNLSSSPSPSVSLNSILLKENHRKEKIKINKLNLDELQQQFSNSPSLQSTPTPPVNTVATTSSGSNGASCSTQSTPELKSMSPPLNSKTDKKDKSFLSLSVSKSIQKQPIFQKMSSVLSMSSSSGSSKNGKSPITSPTLVSTKPSFVPMLQLPVNNNPVTSTNSGPMVNRSTSNSSASNSFLLNFANGAIAHNGSGSNTPTSTSNTSSLAEFNSANPTSPRGAIARNRSHFRNNSSSQSQDVMDVLLIDIENDKANKHHHQLQTPRNNNGDSSNTLTPPATTRTRERRGTISSERDLRMLCVPMLTDILKDLNSRKCFKSFLTTEYSEENLEFWCAVEQYRKIETKREKLTQCERIFNEFVAEHSNQQINIPHTIYKQIQDNFNRKQFLDTIFDEAQSAIFQLMECDSFERFKKSSFYFQYYSSPITSNIKCSNIGQLV